MDISRIKKEMGLRLRAFRNENHLTQEQLSELIELKPSNISNIEQGKTYPGFTTLCSLIRDAGIEPNYLFGFLQKNNTPYSSALLEIMDLISGLSIEQQQSLKAFLSTLK